MRSKTESGSVQQASLLWIAVVVLVGAVIGLGSLLLWPTGQAAAPAQAEVASSALNVPPVAQVRWFIWEGSAPFVGQPFGSSDECEQAREYLVANGEQMAEKALQELPPMTRSDLATFGNPADRIMENLDQIRRAYCRAES